MPNGGARPGAGRKPKAEEVALIERLSPMDDSALNALKTGLKAGDFSYVKLFMEYRFGKPKEKVEVSGGFNIVWNEILNNGADDKANEGS